MSQTTDEQEAALGRLRTVFRLFARTQCEGRSALYTRLAYGLAKEEPLLRMLLAAPPSQRRPSLLLASVNHLLGADRRAPARAARGLAGDRRERGRSPVTLSTVLRGGGPVDRLLGALPAIGYRMGAVVEADACRDTAALVAQVPGSSPVVVFTASLLSYLDTDARGQFMAQLATAARDREVAWLFTEAPGLLTRTDVTVPALRGPLRNSGEIYAVGVSLRSGSDHDDEVLALAHPYLEWIAPAHKPADDFSWGPAEKLFLG